MLQRCVEHAHSLNVVEAERQHEPGVKELLTRRLRADSEASEELIVSCSRSEDICSRCGAPGVATKVQMQGRDRLQ